MTDKSVDFDNMACLRKIGKCLDQLGLDCLVRVASADLPVSEATGSVLTFVRNAESQEIASDVIRKWVDSTLGQHHGHGSSKSRILQEMRLIGMIYTLVQAIEDLHVNDGSE